MVSGLFGFILGRVSASLGRREKRQQSARLIIHDAQPIVESIRHNRDTFRQANQSGNQKVRAYFQMTLEVFPSDDGQEFQLQCRQAVDFSDRIVADLRKAGTDVVKLEKRHNAIREGLEYNIDWQSVREAYLHLLEDTLASVSDGVKALRRTVPRESRPLVDAIVKAGDR